MDRFATTATNEEKEALMEAMNELQMLELQRMFNSLSQRCFKSCVNNFRSRMLDSSEKKCVENCAQKYLFHMQRVGMRFQEESGPGGAMNSQPPS